MINMKQPGTHEGDKQEIELVKFFNLNKKRYISFIEKFQVNIENSWLIRVTTKQFSSLSNKIVFSRADAYLIESFDNKVKELSETNDGYLDENILAKLRLKYKFVPYSGVSIKLSTSSKYQIIKLGPTSFHKLFGSYELGAGASLFCMRETELIKNSDLIEGWNLTLDDMNKYFMFINNGYVNFETNKSACEAVKKYSLKKIYEQINESADLQEKIFNGKTLYEEPYTAWYFAKGLEIVSLKNINFTVTTGSGRSKGDYTIVLKPI